MTKVSFRAQLPPSCRTQSPTLKSPHESSDVGSSFTSMGLPDRPPAGRYASVSLLPQRLPSCAVELRVVEDQSRGVEPCADGRFPQLDTRLIRSWWCGGHHSAGRRGRG